MNTKGSTQGNWVRRGWVVALSMALLVGGLPSVAVVAESRPAPVQATLGELAGLLQRLEGELAALEAPMAERLEERLENSLEAITSILAEFDRPHESGEASAPKLRLLRLDLMMHRLLYVLDELVEQGSDDPERPNARDAVEGLRRWMVGYVNAMTSGMEPAQAERFEAAAHQAMRDLLQRLAAVAQRVRPAEENRPVLTRIVERLEDLLFRLDGLLLGRFPAPYGPQQQP